MARDNVQRRTDFVLPGEQPDSLKLTMGKFARRRAED
jgi:hypothetical protein